MVHFDQKVLPGPSYVALRFWNNKDSSHSENVGGIYLADNSASNSRLANYVVEAVGEIAEAEYGLKVGDHVVADKAASFYHSEPIALMAYNNVILKANEDFTKYYPLKNKVLVEEDETKVENSGGIYLAVNPDTLRTGTIIDMNVVPAKDSPCQTYPFKIGDHVMLVRKGDFVMAGTQKLWVFDPDQIICKLEA